MVSQRMWSLLPAVLVQKKTQEQTASQTWDPPFPPGGLFIQKESGFGCVQERWIKISLLWQCWAHSPKDAPSLQQWAAGHLLFSVLQESESAKWSGGPTSKSQGQQVPCTCNRKGVVMIWFWFSSAAQVATPWSLCDKWIINFIQCNLLSKHSLQHSKTFIRVLKVQWTATAHTINGMHGWIITDRPLASFLMGSPIPAKMALITPPFTKQPVTCFITAQLENL